MEIFAPFFYHFRTCCQYVEFSYFNYLYVRNATVHALFRLLFSESEVCWSCIINNIWYITFASVILIVNVFCRCWRNCWQELLINKLLNSKSSWLATYSIGVCHFNIYVIFPMISKSNKTSISSITVCYWFVWEKVMLYLNICHRPLFFGEL